MDYREDNKAERESRAAIFERKLTELGAGMPRAHRSDAATRQIDEQAELPPSEYWLIEPLRYGTTRWFVNCGE